MDPSNLVEPVVEIAAQAAEKIMHVYSHNDVISVQEKHDNTPVTEADMLSNNFIVNALEKLTPDYPVLSEEGEQFNYEIRKKWETYWLVDPLDGTREFIHKTDEFCINIALIHQHKPILGVIFSPVTKTCYTGCLGHSAIYRKKGSAEKIKAISHWQGVQPIRIVISRRVKAERLALLYEQIGNYELIRCGSALKFCSIAQGNADIYPRLGSISEWDTAAGQCILECAGGAVIDFEGNSLCYNKKDDLLQPAFLAVSDMDAALTVLQYWR